MSGESHWWDGMSPEQMQTNMWYKSRYDNAHDAGTFSGINQMDAGMYGGGMDRSTPYMGGYRDENDNFHWGDPNKQGGGHGVVDGHFGLGGMNGGTGNEIPKTGDTRTYFVNGVPYTVTNDPNYNATGMTLVGMGRNYVPSNGITAGGSRLGNWLQGHVPLIGGILGRVADVGAGAVNVALGVGSFGQLGSGIGTGFGEIGGGVGGLAQIGITDVGAGSGLSDMLTRKSPTLLMSSRWVQFFTTVF